MCENILTKSVIKSYYAKSSKQIYKSSLVTCLMTTHLGNQAQDNYENGYRTVLISYAKIRTRVCSNGSVWHTNAQTRRKSLQVDFSYVKSLEPA